MAINLTDVVFTYPEQPDTPVLDIPSWSLKTGESTLIYGASGSGKSTLLNILNGLLSVKTGHVEVFNSNLEKMTRRQRDKFRANNIGYVFQQFNLIPYLDAIDNIRLAGYFSNSNSSFNKEVNLLLNTLNISEKDRNKPIRQLSIGQQQRIAIARALINKPTLLIADEPTSSLDRQNTDSFMMLLMSLVKEHNITLIFVSHDMTLSQYFTRVESLSDINRIEVSYAD